MSTNDIQIATPTPRATSDISVVEKTTFNGKVFDDLGSQLDGATIKARSLNSSVPYDATTSSAGGSYAFNNAPAGVQIEISASRPGYTTRRRVEVLKSNKTGDPSANRYDFGGNDFGQSYNALSDMPEVVAVTPGRNASGIDPDTRFVLKFSEPMDTETVEDNFGVYVASDTTLSVGVTLNQGGLIWNDQAFNISWDADDMEATFTFTDERRLPTDRRSDVVPRYAVRLSVDDGSIKDKSGISRSSKPFKLTDGDFETQFSFDIDSDRRAPSVKSVSARTNENGGDDEIRVIFSEPMALFTRSADIYGDVGGGGSQSPLAAANYIVTIQGENTVSQSWADFGGQVRFDPDFNGNSAVLLETNGSEVVQPGNLVSIEVSESITDPAGNSLSGDSSLSTTAN